MGRSGRAQATDAAVVARSVQEPAAFAKLFERHFSVIHRFLTLRAGEQTAGDLASETFVIAFRRRAEYDVTRPDARPWLFGIAANLAREQHRSERRRRETWLRLVRERPPESENNVLAPLE